VKTVFQIFLLKEDRSNSLSKLLASTNNETLSETQRDQAEKYSMT